MFEFIRRVSRIIDPTARARFILFGIGSVGVAVLEAIGVALVLPLTQVLVEADGSKIPGSAKFVHRFFHSANTPDRIAAILAILVLVVFIIKAVFAILLLRWSIGNCLQQEARLAHRLFTRYLNAPYTYHVTRNSAEIQRTLNESLLIIFRRTLPWVLATCAEIVSLIAILAVLVFNDPSVAGIAFIYFALVGVSYQRFIGGRQKVAAMKSHRETVQRYRQVQEPVKATKELAVLHRQNVFVEQFYETKVELMEAQRLLAFYQLVPRYFLDMAFLLGAGVVAAFTFATRSNTSALASVGLFMAAGFRLVPPLNRVMGTSTIARTAQPGVDQVIADLAELDALDEERRELVTDRFGPTTVEVDHVDFAYEGATDTTVLDDVTLRIEPGDDVGIVGSTAAGKTTLLDILLGLLDPVAGDVLVNGQRLRECRTGWQLSIGYVPQEIVLLDASIRANVAFGIHPRDVDDERLWEALRQAQIDDFVLELPEGLDTTVGEDGVRLSGGQRQRLGLARALYSQPSVLVLDEATSALDSATESRIIDTIVALRGRLTIITVAHRLSTLRHCDRIYFLRQGRIVAVGTFDELRATVPEFANLVTLAQLTSSDDDLAPAAHDAG